MKQLSLQEIRVVSGGAPSNYQVWLAEQYFKAAERSGNTARGQYYSRRGYEILRGR